ncbi:Epoxyqueuosine reductase [Nymphon striatum]|nr:Epoxyqueuosine reductase [Nymphon striatum]
MKLNHITHQNLKQWAMELGFQELGVSDIELSKTEGYLHKWLSKNFQGDMEWMGRHGTKRTRPGELEPGTISIISVRMNYRPPETHDPIMILNHPEKAYISRYALGRDYHKMMRKRLQKLANKIRENLVQEHQEEMQYRVFVDSAPVMEKPIAAKAGLGWVGKHTNVLSQDAGSWFFLGEIYTNLPLTPSNPVDNHCGDCTACIDVCPTRAIVKPYVLDARRCISYLTIEHKGLIPEEFRQAIGNRIYGCDDCQLVCPWNRFANTAEQDDFAILVSTYAKAEIDTANIYSDVEKSVYQIRVINKQTGKKSSIGSGFVVSRNDIMATNYHVVSEYINDPDVYTLDFLSTSGKTGSLELLDFDIVHDLAVVKTKQPMGDVLEISDIPEKGASLFSLGNPMDLGFTIVKGTNNGILAKDEDGNILFSGSLNPGMSGGPTLDEKGNVIGINVATSGNDISFLVPADYLRIVLDRVKANKFRPIDDRFVHSSDQLRGNSNKILSKILKNPWSGTRIGAFVVPAELDKSMRCWDASRKPKDDDLFRSYFTRCSNEDNIFLSSRLDVGSINYEYV